MKKLLNILVILIPALTFGQGFLPMDTIDAPPELIHKIPGQIVKTYFVDFNGDGIKDYICQTDLYDKEKFAYYEYWMDSDFRIIKKAVKYYEDIDYFWLVNLDNDPEPELFSASGWAEGVDYCLIDQNLQTGKDSIMFYFNPIIIEDNIKNWGYPWDIKDLLIQGKNGEVQLFCSMDHDIIRDGEITKPIWQGIFPVICFSGHTTQPDIRVNEIRDLKWINIKEIKARTHNTRYSQ